MVTVKDIYCDSGLRELAMGVITISKVVLHTSYLTIVLENKPVNPYCVG